MVSPGILQYLQIMTMLYFHIQTSYFSPLHFLHIDKALHYCVNYQHSWLFPNLKGISMQSHCTPDQLLRLSSTSAITQGPSFGVMLCCCCLEIIIIFEQGTLHFYFALGTANYVAGTVLRAVSDIKKPATIKCDQVEFLLRSLSYLVNKVPFYWHARVVFSFSFFAR